MAARTSILKLGQTEKKCMCHPYFKKKLIIEVNTLCGNGRQN